MTLEGRVVVITGATGGLGRTAAGAFANRGANLVVAGTHQARLDGLVNELGLPAGRILAFQGDLSAAAQASALARAAVERFGRVDVLLHLVGGWVGGKGLVETGAADMAAMIDQHCWTTWHLLQAFLPPLLANGWGRIIAVSSPFAIHPDSTTGPYAAAKAAQEALLLTAARETNGRGVTANIVHVRAIDEERRRQPGSSSATPEEIVAALLYLCSDEGGMVSGARLPVTGGAG